MIRGTPEILENPPGEALAHRTTCMSDYVGGLGPPDMCVIEKMNQDWTSSGKESYYHYILGLAPDSAAKCAIYVKSLLSHQQLTGWLQTKTTLTKVTLCIYNSFSRRDTRVEVTIPGGVTEYTLDMDQNKATVLGEQHWKETFLCSVLRAMGRVPWVPAVKVLNPTVTLPDEKEALKIATKLFWEGHQLGSPTALPSDAYNNNMVRTIYKYFQANSRYTAWIEFIRPFTKQLPTLVVYIAETYMLQRKWVEAAQEIQWGLQQQPRSPQLLSCYAKLLLQHELADHNAFVDILVSSLTRPTTTTATTTSASSSSSSSSSPSSKHPQDNHTRANGPRAPPGNCNEGSNVSIESVASTTGSTDMPTSLTKDDNASQVLPASSALNETTTTQRGEEGSITSDDNPAGAPELKSERVNAAHAALQAAIQLQPNNPENFVLLASLCASTKQFALAIALLNEVPIHSVVKYPWGQKVTERDFLFPDPNPSLGIPQRCYSANQVTLTEPNDVDERIYWDDDVFPEDDLDPTRSTPEATQLADQTLADLQGNYLCGIAADVYAVLVNIIHCIGWDPFLALRSEVFYMEVEKDGDKLNTSAIPTVNETIRWSPDTGSAVDTSATATVLNKKLSTKWFDYLVFAVFDDLSQLAEWKGEEEEFKSKHRGVIDPNDPDDANVVDMDNGTQTILDARRPSEDWYYRGRVAQRLQRNRDAELAYRMSAWQMPNVRALQRLIDLYGHHLLVKETIALLDYLLDQLHGTTQKESKSDNLIASKDTLLQMLKAEASVLYNDSISDLVTVPVQPVVTRNMYRLIHHYGLLKVWEMLLELDKWHPDFQQVLKQAYELGIATIE